MSVRTNMSGKPSFCSWSGGKDSLMALYKAQKSGLDVRYLLNTITSSGKYSRSHGLPGELMQMQAEELNIQLIQVPTTWKIYEAKFKSKLRKLRREGIEVGIFGDIDLEPHREWVERICCEVDMSAVLPLWKIDREALVHSMVEEGFRSIVVTIRADLLDKSWLGREIDEEFIRELKALGNIDLCGENGEFHTFVYDGPNFKSRVKFRSAGDYFRGKYGQLRLEVKF